MAVPTTWKLCANYLAKKMGTVVGHAAYVDTDENYANEYEIFLFFLMSFYQPQYNFIDFFGQLISELIHLWI